jgi:osmotically-inducible protein OsmY|tara:strand:- start:669 stop:836 length:168 start_codon:yes stop_codon:yes gene_type:complete
MKYEVVINIEIDDDSNKLEVGDTSNLDTVTKLIESALYDIDDLEIEDIDVVRRID